MQMTHGWTGLRMAALTLAFGLTATVAAPAAPIKGETPATLMSYKTSGTIDTSTGITGPTDVVAINFRSVDEGSFQSPSSFSLGEFVVAALPQGVVTTYTNTPFKISYFTEAVDGVTPDPNDSPITVSGVLNGTVSGPSQSDVVATFDPITDSAFRTGNFLNTISILSPEVSLVPSTTNGGRTTAQARIRSELSPVPPPVPEPATLTIFVAAIAGLGLRRRLRARLA